MRTTIRGDTWVVALDALRANKVRAFLTTLGVVIGSACVVLVVTVALTGRKYVIGQIESVGANLVTAITARTPSQTTPLSFEINLGDLEALKSGISQVQEVAGARQLPTTAVVGGIERPVTLVGVTNGYQTIRNLVIL